MGILWRVRLKAQLCGINGSPQHSPGLEAQSLAGLVRPWSPFSWTFEDEPQPPPEEMLPQDTRLQFGPAQPSKESPKQECHKSGLFLTS